MIKQWFRSLSKDLGIDLGTTCTSIFCQDKGIVIREPSVVAVNMRTDHIVAVGNDARDMIGKNPPHIVPIKPLTKGVISDFEVTSKMLKYFVDRVYKESFTFLPRPRIVIGAPLETTEVERKAIEDVVLSAGARSVALVENPMLAAVGARLPIADSLGTMIVDLGGGKTEIAVISLAGVVTWKSLPVAGDELNRNIMQYAREMFNLLLGDRIAEMVKMRVGSALPLDEVMQVEMRGRDLLSGLPKELIVSDGQIREAIQKSISIIVDNIKATLEVTPPELVADIYERGIVLVGGGSLLRGIDVLIAKQTSIPVRVAEDPMTCVVRGAGMLLSNEGLLRDMTLPSTSQGGIV